MSENGRWRVVQASVTGVAHRNSETECQDACAVQQLFMPDGVPVLILVAADGAGSAIRSREGAERACQILLAECANWLAQVNNDGWQPTVALSWLHHIQASLAQHAADAGLPVREFACTLLGAIIAPDQALLLQIGDGAIIVESGDGYRPIFWPQGGEYPNETWFVTDVNAATRLECTTLTESVGEIALLTDGLQPLALHYQSHQAHEPFFRPMFQSLRDYPEDGCLAALTQALEQFLDSPAVNQRTHDDKTLILASRLAAPETAPAIPAGGELAPATGLREDNGDEVL
ncbi:MAG: protein phosphatase 2C domain-containing protein [Candidatus Competibacteraceae bacterium]|nr:protein phosphatase 2C domain-containing protein [Candidatus Competibacteraceae bacterium]